MHEFRTFIENRFRDEIRARQEVEPVSGEFCDFPEGVNPDLKKVLEKQGIQTLYSHQSEAFSSITSGQNTLLVSNTASGKTLSFFLPVLNEYLKSETPFSVLLMYPTKALSRDQENTFGTLMQVVNKSGKLGTFDGDTPRDERVRIQRSADFVITNPDMLHSGMLPNHNRKWRTFLSRLKYVIIDEVHIYRGAFGSHVSNVFRRLLRVCGIHGSSPSFVCSSATVGNPEEHVEALFHRPFHVIKKDGAPRSGRSLYFINPPMVQSHGHTLYRKGPGSVSVPLIRQAAKSGFIDVLLCICLN